MKIFWAATSFILPSFAVASSYAPCNGHAELCDRTYNKVSFACTHNAYSYPPPIGLPVLNQERTIQQQLDDGIRAFMLDVVKPSELSGFWNKVEAWFHYVFLGKKDTINDVHLCHQSCDLIDKGTLLDTLNTFASFLEAHPREVVTFIIENVSGFKPNDLQPSFAAAGLEKYAYIPEFQPNSQHQNYTWPTLAQLIDKNQRLVVFIDTNADPSQVAYILPEWEYVVEIPYANINPVKEFPCNQDRPRDGVPRDLLVMNHFVYNRLTIGDENIDSPIYPSQIKEHGYNSLQSLNTHLHTCKKAWGDRVMNFVTLDYYDIGNSSIFKLVDQINGFL
ncbi:PLC-like phosphodiesterase [Martensiomyces pterosporus]|nr:PLC-like phosphodiesterase [Martensiomyces pterosporus]